MDFLVNRYRNLTVLLVVIVGQLLLLAYQVKANKDVPLIRVWAVSTVTPVEQGLEWVRRHTIGYLDEYFVLLHVREQNESLKRELDRTKLENHYLRTELSTADRARELNVFQQHTPSKTLAARVIGNGTGANSRVVFIDRGSASGIENGVAVITPDGIVGKVVAAYPTASLVMLATDPTFAAGVISQKNHVHGTLKGSGGPKCKIDYIQNEEKVDVGEWFYTSGDDGIFPRGFPVGQVSSVRNGRTAKEIYLTPSGWQGGLDEVLVVTEGVHQVIPEPRIAAAPVKILPRPSGQANAGAPKNSPATLNTDADKLKQEYKQLADQDKVLLGEGHKAPDFTQVGKPAAQVNPALPAQARPPTADQIPVERKSTGQAADKIQREHSNTRVTQDANTEILPPAPPPKRAAPAVPKSSPQKPGATTVGTGRPGAPMP